MRIIRGEFSGRSLISPKSKLTRPTSDKVRQAIFNILENNIDMPVLKGAHVLDCFAGTGALGLEALSRGALHVTLVDSQRAAYLNLNNTVHAWEVHERVEVVGVDVLKLPEAQKSVDIVFCDPPYGQSLVDTTIKVLSKKGWVVEDTLVVAETHRKDTLSAECDIIQEKIYGDTKVAFFRYLVTLKGASIG